MSRCSEHFHFISHSSLFIEHEPVNALALITEVLRFDWILRIGSSKRVLFVLRRDPNYVGGKARREDCELDKQQYQQNSKGCFHILRYRKTLAIGRAVRNPKFEIWPLMSDI